MLQSFLSNPTMALKIVKLLRNNLRNFMNSLFGIFCLSSILTYLLAMVIYYAINSTLPLPGVKAGFILPEVQVPEPEIGKTHRILTLEELKEYNGKDPDKPLLLALRGVVFDVSKRKDYFAPGSGWSHMTGHDVTRATARRTFDPAYFDNLSLEFLTDDELRTLDHEFRENYMKEYPVYGYMDYFYNENIDLFTPIDDSEVDEEVWVNPVKYEEPDLPDPAEVEAHAREAREAEARVDRELAERWAKWEEEQRKQKAEL